MTQDMKQRSEGTVTRSEKFIGCHCFGMVITSLTATPQNILYNGKTPIIATTAVWDGVCQMCQGRRIEDCESFPESEWDHIMLLTPSVLLYVRWG